MQYIVRNRRRLRPATGELVRATATAPAPARTTTPAAVAATDPPARAEGSGPHRRPLVTEINLTTPLLGRDR